MAQIVTIQVLVDIDPEVFDFDKATKRESLQKIVDAGTNGDCVDSIVTAERVIPELDDAICNDTYTPGDAFRASAMLFSRGLHETHGDDMAWYSAELRGWVSKNDATRIKPVESEAHLLKAETWAKFAPDMTFIFD